MTNTKKKHGNKMKLMSAIGMLTVSAAMLVSSTFAWFSMNKQVTASTMSVQAKSADPIIEISANGSDFYNELTTSGSSPNWTLPSTTYTAGGDVKLKLVTPTAIASSGATAGTVSWGWTSSTAHDAAQGTKATSAVALTAATDPAKTESNRGAYLGDGNDLYVLTQKVTVRNVSPDIVGNNLKIDNVTIDGGSNTIAASVRLLFVSDGKYALYNGSGSLIAEGDQWLQSTNSSAMTVASGKPIIASTIAANKTQEIDIDVYLFFDGTDDSAYTDNATNLSSVTASFTFGID